MEKKNYQLETDRVIKRLEDGGIREKLLLHACCAPCASYVLEYLTQHFDITLFFCNPNITDRDEYLRRLGELYKLCELAPFCRGVDIVEDTLPTSSFFEAAAGTELEPEGGSRCSRCFSLRLNRTAGYAKAHRFPIFATTLTVSPHKNAALINALGAEEASAAGVEYLPSDFKKRGGYQRSIVLCREYDIYRQQYCGCVFSMPKPQE